MYRVNNESLCDKLIVIVKNKLNNFGDYSSLHGIGNVLSKNPISFFKRLFWSTIVVCCCIGASSVLKDALNVYSGDIISYSVDTNYLKFDTPFPAVTVCEQPGSSDRIKPYLVSHGLPTSLLAFLKENVFWSLKYCKFCTDCKINQTCVENYIELVDKIRLNCSQILTDCWWDNKYFRCCDRFLPLQTEYGTCFVFNSRLTQNNSSIASVSPKIGLPYLVFTSIQTIQLLETSRRSSKATQQMKDELTNIATACDRTGVSDRPASFIVNATLIDLNVISTDRSLKIIDRSKIHREEKKVRKQLPYDVPILVASNLHQIRIHAPEDVLAVSMENILGRVSTLPLITEFEVLLKAEQTISESSLVSLPVSMRGCLFSHEKPADAEYWNFKEYSYNTCLLYCKAIAQIDACNCTHHLMPQIGNFPSCDIAGSACLYSSLRGALRDIKCNCPMGCEEIYYKTVNIRSYRHSDPTPALVRRGTRATVKFASLPSIRILRHAMRDILALVVDIGGVGGVFFGASLLSFIEIFYLFFIRQER